MQLANQLGLPRAALSGGDRPLPSLPPGASALAVRSTPFPEMPTDAAFPSRLADRFAIADLLGHPLGRLGPDDLGFIDALLSETLVRDLIISRVRERFGGARGS